MKNNHLNPINDTDYTLYDGNKEEKPQEEYLLQMKSALKEISGIPLGLDQKEGNQYKKTKN